MKEESLLLLSDLQKLINQVVLIDYTIIILGGYAMKQTTDVMNKNHGLSPKEVSIMNKSNLHNKRLQSLNKGKTKSLGPVEKITMTYAGRIDGKKNLLRCNENGIWQSSTLKQEVDSYEEFCAEQMGTLKLQEEDEFKKLNILFDQVIPLRKKLLESKNLLRNAMDEEVDLTSRKEGEDNLTEVQVTARRNREREESLRPFKDAVSKYDKELSNTVESIFTSLSQIKESFDSTVKITNRILQHSQRRIDVYWHSAIRYISELPALPNITFSNMSEQSFADHYEKLVEKAENLRLELASELCEEVM